MSKKSPLRLSAGVMTSCLILSALSFLGGCTSSESPKENSKSNGNLPTLPVQQSDNGGFGAFSIGSPKRNRNEVIHHYMPNMIDRAPRAADYLKAIAAADAEYDYDSIVVLADEAVKLSPSNAEAYYHRGRGRLYSTRSEDSLALSDFQKTVSLNSRKDKAYELMASIYDARHEPDKAVSAMDRAIELKPGDKNLYKTRAALLSGHGDKIAAKKDYDKWIELCPEDSLPRILRGQLLESMNQYEQAIDDYSVASSIIQTGERVSKRELAFKFKARLLSKLGRHSEAIAVLSEALAQNKDEDEFLKMRGDEYASLRKYDLAIKDYSDSIEYSSGFSKQALESRAKVYAILGKRDLSTKDFEKARQLRDAPAEKPVYELERNQH